MDNNSDSPVNKKGIEISSDEETKVFSTVVGFGTVVLFLFVALDRIVSGSTNHISSIFSETQLTATPNLLVTSFIILHHLRL